MNLKHLHAGTILAIGISILAPATSALAVNEDASSPVYLQPFDKQLNVADLSGPDNEAVHQLADALAKQLGGNFNATADLIGDAENSQQILFAVYCVTYLPAASYMICYRVMTMGRAAIDNLLRESPQWCRDAAYLLL